MTNKNEKEFTEAELHNLLVAAGRETGSTWMVHAVESATDVDQMNNQLFVLQVAATHILATCAYNQERQKGREMDLILDEMASEIQSEAEFLKGAEIEKLTVGQTLN